MRKVFSPRPYQRLIAHQIIDVPRCGIWAGMGLGKTSSTLWALDQLTLVESSPALVIAPLRVAQSTWPDEVKKWDFGSRLDVSPILGTPDQRRIAMRRDVPIYTINHENLPWLIQQYGNKWPFRTVVADESTRLKSFRGSMITHPKTGKLFYRGCGGQRARALGRIAHTHVRRFIQLTGTPAPNGLKDLWGQAWFLDAGMRLGRTYSSFIDRWFQKSFDGYSVEPLPLAGDEIHAKLKDICVSFNPRDWFDLKDPIHTVVEVDLPAKAMSLYRDMEREMFAQIEEFGVEAVNAAVRQGKCAQIAAGFAFTEGGKWKDIHDVKIQALDSIISESSGAPILVGYHFKPDLVRLKKAYPEGKVLSNADELRDFKTGKYPLGFGNPASIGLGVDGLQDHCNIVVFYSDDWNLEDRVQFIERIGPVRQAQAGHDRPVFIYDIVARGTVDELVLERHKTKRAVQDILLEATKGKPK